MTFRKMKTLSRILYRWRYILLLYFFFRSQARIFVWQEMFKTIRINVSEDRHEPTHSHHNIQIKEKKETPNIHTRIVAMRLIQIYEQFLFYYTSNELIFFTLKQWRCRNNMLISRRWLWWYLNEDENHPINPRHYHLRLTSPIN